MQFKDAAHNLSAGGQATQPKKSVAFSYGMPLADLEDKPISDRTKRTQQKVKVQKENQVCWSLFPPFSQQIWFLKNCEQRVCQSFPERLAQPSFLHHAQGLGIRLTKLSAVADVEGWEKTMISEMSSCLNMFDMIVNVKIRLGVPNHNLTLYNDLRDISGFMNRLGETKSELDL